MTVRIEPSFPAESPVPVTERVTRAEPTRPPAQSPLGHLEPPLGAEERRLTKAGGPALRRLLVLLDAFAVEVAWAAALVAPLGRPVAATPLELLCGVTALTAVTVVAIAAQRLYLARVSSVRAVEVARLARAATISAAVAWVGAGGAGLDVAPWRLVAGGALAFVLLAGFRSAFDTRLKALRAQGRFGWPVVIVGANDEGFDLYRLLHTHPEMGFRISGVVGARSAVESWGTGVPWLGEVDSAAGAVRAAHANGVVVAASALSPAELNHLCRDLSGDGIHVHLSSGLRGIAQRRLRPMPLAYEPLFYLEPVTLSRAQLAAKRVLDVTLASLMLMVAAPVLLVAAIVIKLQDGGPVLFRQRRVGRGGRPIEVLKLRTMVPDAEARLAGLADDNERDGGPLFKLTADPRRTRFGRLLEAASLDELPQLVNVLKGEMSLVGPRPALPEEVAQFDDELLERLSVPPGITGLWQVTARDNPAFHAYRRLDLFYVENWSVMLDLAILLGTARSLVARVFGRR